ncbi:hypothetical protein F4604DRAFT_1901085 [Suillus subluteus]|nr:hypothetical protein F4604DRAFT_1901085 [Suillus subluteus]
MPWPLPKGPGGNIHIISSSFLSRTSKSVASAFVQRVLVGDPNTGVGETAVRSRLRVFLDSEESSSKTSPDGVLGGVSRSDMGESMPVKEALPSKHNSAIDNHIVMFGLIEERCITHYRMKFYDREKGPILSKLTLKWRVNGQKEEPGWDHEEGPVRNRKETPKRDHHEGPGRNHEERPGRNHHEGPGRNREERPGRNHHNGPERNHEGPGRNHEEIQKAREGPPRETREEPQGKTLSSRGWW